MIKRSLLLCCLLLLSPGLHAQVSQPAALEKKVQDLILALDAREFAVREKAFEELRGLGTDARPIIAKARDRASVEARIRLDILLEEMTGSSSSLDVELNARKIDLVFEQVTIADALALLERKTGFRFAPSPDLDRKRIVNLELRDVAPFEALDRFADHIAQRWVQDYGSGLIRFFQTSPGMTPLVSYQGPFRFSLDSVAVNSALVFGGDLRSNCYLQGKIDLEPGAEVMGLFIQPELVLARDEQDLDVIPPGEVPSNFQLAGPRRNFNFNLRFNAPASGAKKLKRIEARLEVVVARRYDELSLPLHKGPEFRVESPDSSISLRSITRAGANRRMELLIERRIPRTGGLRPADVPHETIEIGTSEGLMLKPLAPVQRQMTGQGEILRFEVSAEGGDLQTAFVRSLAEIETRSLTFSFDDIPLP